MNDEPVAWIDEINTFVLNKDYKQFPKNLQNGMIPLYTHPAKTEDEGKVCARCGAIAYDPVITYPAKPTKVKFASNSCESGWIYLDYEEPAKTLADEEITIIKEVVGNYVCTIKMEIDQEKQTFKGYEHCSNLPALTSELKDAEQALAILRKAQEK